MLNNFFIRDIFTDFIEVNLQTLVVLMSFRRFARVYLILREKQHLLKKYITNI